MDETKPYHFQMPYYAVIALILVHTVAAGPWGKTKEFPQGNQILKATNYFDLSNAVPNAGLQEQKSSEDVDIFVAEIFAEEPSNFEQIFRPLARYKKAVLDVDTQIEPAKSDHEQLASKNSMLVANDEEAHSYATNLHNGQTNSSTVSFLQNGNSIGNSSNVVILKHANNTNEYLSNSHMKPINITSTNVIYNDGGVDGGNQNVSRVGSNYQSIGSGSGSDETSTTVSNDEQDSSGRQSGDNSGMDEDESGYSGNEQSRQEEMPSTIQQTSNVIKTESKSTPAIQVPEKVNIFNATLKGKNNTQINDSNTNAANNSLLMQMNLPYKSRHDTVSLKDDHENSNFYDEEEKSVPKTEGSTSLPKTSHNGRAIKERKEQRNYGEQKEKDISDNGKTKQTFNSSFVRQNHSYDNSLKEDLLGEDETNGGQEKEEIEESLQKGKQDQNDEEEDEMDESIEKESNKEKVKKDKKLQESEKVQAKAEEIKENETNKIDEKEDKEKEIDGKEQNQKEREKDENEGENEEERGGGGRKNIVGVKEKSEVKEREETKEEENAVKEINRTEQKQKVRERNEKEGENEEKIEGGGRKDIEGVKEKLEVKEREETKEEENAVKEINRTEQKQKVRERNEKEGENEGKIGGGERKNIDGVKEKDKKKTEVKEKVETREEENAVKEIDRTEQKQKLRERNENEEEGKEDDKEEKEEEEEENKEEGKEDDKEEEEEEEEENKEKSNEKAEKKEIEKQKGEKTLKQEIQDKSINKINLVIRKQSKEEKFVDKNSNAFINAKSTKKQSPNHSLYNTEQMQDKSRAEWKSSEDNKNFRDNKNILSSDEAVRKLFLATVERNKSLVSDQKSKAVPSNHTIEHFYEMKNHNALVEKIALDGNLVNHTTISSLKDPTNFSKKISENIVGAKITINTGDNSKKDKGISQKIKKGSNSYAASQKKKLHLPVLPKTFDRNFHAKSFQLMTSDNARNRKYGQDRKEKKFRKDKGMSGHLKHKISEKPEIKGHKKAKSHADKKRKSHRLKFRDDVAFETMLMSQKARQLYLHLIHDTRKVFLNRKFLKEKRRRQHSAHRKLSHNGKAKHMDIVLKKHDDKENKIAVNRNIKGEKLGHNVKTLAHRILNTMTENDKLLLNQTFVAPQIIQAVKKDYSTKPNFLDAKNSLLGKLAELRYESMGNKAAAEMPEPSKENAEDTSLINGAIEDDNPGKTIQQKQPGIGIAANVDMDKLDGMRESYQNNSWDGTIEGEIAINETREKNSRESDIGHLSVKQYNASLKNLTDPDSVNGVESNILNVYNAEESLKSPGLVNEEDDDITDSMYLEPVQRRLHLQEYLVNNTKESGTAKDNYQKINEHNHHSSLYFVGNSSLWRNHQVVSMNITPLVNLFYNIHHQNLIDLVENKTSVKKPNYEHRQPEHVEGHKNQKKINHSSKSEKTKHHRTDKKLKHHHMVKKIHLMNKKHSMHNKRKHRKKGRMDASIRSELHLNETNVKANAPSVPEIKNHMPTSVNYYKIENAATLGAVCIDGSTPGYYLRPGYESGKNKWIIHLHGGAWCYNLQTCYRRSLSLLGSTNHWSAENITNFFQGMLSDKKELNPKFHNWNVIVQTYCDGGLFSGKRKEPIVYNGKKLYFRGRTILKAMIESLKRRGLNLASDIILSGTSAGGLAVILQGEYIKRRLPKTAEVRFLVDAGFFLDAPGQEWPNIVRDQFKGLYAIHQPKLKLKCERSREKAEKFMCLFPQYFLGYTNLPVYFVNSLYDHWQLSELQGLHCVYNNNKCSPKERDQILNFRNVMFSVIQKTLKQMTAVGLFANSCIGHGQVIVDYTWSRVRVNNETISDAFDDWLQDKQNQSKHYCVDCRYPCNGSCPKPMVKSCIENFKKTSLESRTKRNAELC